MTKVTTMLTRKQKELLLFLNAKINRQGVCPSFDEMRIYLGLKSKSGVAGLVVALEKRGFIRRHHNAARAIEVVRLPEEASQDSTPEDPSTSFVSIPFFGEIAAGTPLFDQDREPGPGDAHVLVPQDYCAGKGIHYAIEVRGDSMTELGIFDGDMAIIERCRTARDGDVVSALVDNSEVTLKTYRQVGDKIYLVPANPDFKVQVYEPERVKIHGRLVTLVRKYR